MVHRWPTTEWHSIKPAQQPSVIPKYGPPPQQPTTRLYGPPPQQGFKVHIQQQSPPVPNGPTTHHKTGAATPLYGPQTGAASLFGPQHGIGSYQGQQSPSSTYVSY